MNGAQHRLEILVAISSLLALLCTATTSCRPSLPPPFVLHPLASGVWAAIDNPKSPNPAAANAGFVVGDDGVAVIDTFGNPDAAALLRSEIRRITPRPIKYVVNTHHHLDHVAGNGEFRESVIMAHRNVRSWIRTENLRSFGAVPELKARVDAVVPPSVVFDEDADVYLGGRELHVRTLMGHTGGDVVAIIPSARVIFAGDLFWHAMLPNLTDGSIDAWTQSLEALRSYDNYRFVPGHGEIGTTVDVAEFREYLITLRQLVWQGREWSEDVLLAAALPKLRQIAGRWTFSDDLARENVLQTRADLLGTKRLPKSEP
jgi:glyoxylase-like metal-dependent hydrolase (beta-lactamase superfamily II)